MKRIKRILTLFIAALMALCLCLLAAAAGPPVITRQPQSRTFPENSVAIWSVEAYGDNLSYHWYIEYNGRVYDTRASYEENIAWAANAGEEYGVNPAGTTFHINGIQSGISGAKIYCEVSNGAATVKSQPAVITITEAGTPMPPTIVVPASMTVEIGANVDLYCSATDPNGGSLSYLWYETGSGRLEDIIAINRGVETDSSLHCDTGSAGTRYYVCLVTTSSGGSAYTNPIAVTVLNKTAAKGASIVKQPSDAAVGDGAKAIFTCKAEGAVSYQWWRASSSPLNTSDPTAVKLKNGEGISGATTATLTVTAGEALDGNGYLCVVTGEDGVQVCTRLARLSVTGDTGSSSSSDESSSEKSSQAHAPNGLTQGSSAKPGGESKPGAETDKRSLNWLYWVIGGVAGTAVIGGGVAAIIILSRKKRNAK